MAVVAAFEAVIVLNDKCRPILACIAVIGAFVIGVLFTIAWGAWMEMAGQSREEGQRRKIETIVIEESPFLTRSARLLSSESHRRVSETVRARRRGGLRSYSSHRKHVTRVFNPGFPDDCAFTCILRAAGVRVTKHAIDDLRVKTAEKIYTAYIKDETHGAMRARDLVQSSGHSLSAYLALLRWNMWASPLEVILAAQVLDVHIAVSVGGALMCYGTSPKFLVRLAKHHYTLHALWKPMKPKGRVPAGRGGMMGPSGSASSSSTTVPWTWQHTQPNTVSILSLPPAALTPEVREEVPEWAMPSGAPPGLDPPEEKEVKIVKVEVAPSLRTDILALKLSVRASLSLDGFRSRLAGILQVSTSWVTLYL